jgi:5-deoxy-glucuronate isomerase
MNLISKGTALEAGLNPIMGPGPYPLKYLRLERLVLGPSFREHVENSGGDEIGLSILSGRCAIHVDGEKPWESLGGRSSVFSGPPCTVYIPRRRRWRVMADSAKVDIGIFRAPSRRDTAPAVVRPDDVEVLTPGTGAWKRRVVVPLGERIDADRLLMGETYSAAGGWSSYPPHKHDTRTPPKEAWYEEVYHYFVQPAQGFGLQRVYTAPGALEPLDEVYVVEDGDAVALPRGFHPVVAAGGYELAYFWALAGEERIYAAWSDDPRHAWLRSVETK